MQATAKASVEKNIICDWRVTALFMQSADDMDCSRLIWLVGICISTLPAYQFIISERQERGILVYPYGGAWKWVVNLATPVKMPNRTLAMNLQFQWQYSHIKDIHEITKYLPLIKGRSHTFRAIGSLMDRLGLDGNSCVKRAICEAAETPLLHQGLFGEIVHLLLTPTKEDQDMDEFFAAYDLGTSHTNCLESYPKCPLGSGLLDSISQLIHY